MEEKDVTTSVVSEVPIKKRERTASLWIHPVVIIVAVIIGLHPLNPLFGFPVRIYIYLTLPLAVIASLLAWKSIVTVPYGHVAIFRENGHSVPKMEGLYWCPFRWNGSRFYTGLVMHPRPMSIGGFVDLSFIDARCGVLVYTFRTQYTMMVMDPAYYLNPDGDNPCAVLQMITMTYTGPFGVGTDKEFFLKRIKEQFNEQEKLIHLTYLRCVSVKINQS